MESYIREYFHASYDDVNDDELLLERRLSPYATLRPGDLAALLKFHSSLPATTRKICRSNENIIKHFHKIDAIIEKEQLGLSSGESDDERTDEDDLISVMCRGADQGHIPVEYKMTGLKQHEVPVIGVYVDNRVCPGFRYHVRRAGTSDFFWDNKAKTLESIGMGYGRRLTFSCEILNNSDCYFWSDSDPNGFAFSIQAVDVGQKFIIQDACEKVVGDAIIEKVRGPQEEISMETGKNGVTKRVSVGMICQITYYQQHHYGLKELMAAQIQEPLSGEAILIKSRRSRKASLTAIEGVFLSRFGQCTLVPDC